MTTGAACASFLGPPRWQCCLLYYFFGRAPSFLPARATCASALIRLLQLRHGTGSRRRRPQEPQPGRAVEPSGVAKKLQQASNAQQVQDQSPRKSRAEYFLPLFLLLIAMDAGRSYFVSGSAYLCKDLFEMMRIEEWLSPTLLNVIASISPLVGLFLGERLVWLGVRPLMFVSCACAASALVLLGMGSVRGRPSLVLTIVLVYKLNYGPTGVCCSLMKVEAFPAEFRATAFAVISLSGKLLCALGPMLVEALKRDELASSWSSQELAVFILSLAGAALVSGILALCVPHSPDGCKATTTERATHLGRDHCLS